MHERTNAANAAERAAQAWNAAETDHSDEAHDRAVEATFQATDALRAAGWDVDDVDWDTEAGTLLANVAALETEPLPANVQADTLWELVEALRGHRPLR